MSSPNASLRHRGPQKDKSKTDGKIDKADEILDQVIQSTKTAVTSQWDYKLALGIITALAFVTRFWGIGHPNEVVFDEVHFGKVKGKGLVHRSQAALTSLSLRLTTSNGPISSMSTHPSENCFLPLWAGSSDMMDIFCSTTLAIRTLTTRCPTWRSGPSLP